MRRFLTALRKRIAEILPRRACLAPAPVRRPVSARRQGLTLVEMLVTVAITLIMMAAVVNIFASVGQSVQHRRATMEMGNQVRIVRTLLAQDLARATTVTLPPRDPASAEGYLEIIEGRHTDWFPTSLRDDQARVERGNHELDPTDLSTSLIPRAKLASEKDNGTIIENTDIFRQLGLSGLGDYDDVLAFTVRSQGEPFIGRLGTTTIKSNEAEIIWYAVENPPVPAGHRLYLGEPGMRTIYRRVLLVAPWVEAELTNEITKLNEQLGLAPVLPAVDDGGVETLRRFHRYFDLSVRRHPASGRWIPNTLADLTKRENRFAHLPDQFPHTMDLRRIRLTDPFVISNNSSDGSLRSRTPLVPFGTIMEFDRPDAIPPNEVIRLGEDVVLRNVLAFDLRVFDPRAPLVAVDGNVLEPSDIGWRQAVESNPTVVGQGAYVDLAYMGDPTSDVYEPFDVPPATATSQFSMKPHPRAGFRDVTNAGVRALMSQLDQRFLIRSAYDTWSFHYEYDGLNQDGQFLNGTPLMDNWTDEGTDAVDEDGDRGVDDVLERETLPPYMAPLRGMEVKLRVYEVDSRTIREVSVKQDFTH